MALSTLPTSETNFQNLSFISLLSATFEAELAVYYTRNVAESPVLDFFLRENALRPPLQLQNQSPANSDDRLVFHETVAGLSGLLQVDAADEEVDLGSFTLIESYMNLLNFANQLKLSPLQLQKLLQIFRDTHAEITWVESEDQLGNASKHFAERLTQAMARKTVPAIETVVERQVVMEERVDPNAPPIDPKAKPKKGQPPPEQQKILVKTIVEKEVEHQRNVTIDPFFNSQELESIVGFVTQSLFLHWRLFRHVATVDRQRETRSYELGICDLQEGGTQALQDAVPLDSHDKTNERLAFVGECEGVLNAEYEVWLESVDALRDEYLQQTRVAKAADDERADEDRKVAMKPNEFERTQQVLKNRMEKRLKAATTTPAAAVADDGAAKGDDGTAGVGAEENLEEKIARLEKQISAAVQAKQEAQPKGKR